MKERHRFVAFAPIYAAGVVALAGCGGSGDAVTFSTPAYKNGYDCGRGLTGVDARELVEAVASCRSSAVLAGNTVTPTNDFDNGVSDGWHTRHGF